MAGLGLVSALPAGYVEFHDFMHIWELPMIVASGALLALGWGLYIYSKRVNCHDTGCSHGPCGPKKDKSRLILIVASALFFVNIGVYSVIHQNVFGVFSDAVVIDDHGAHAGHAHQGQHH